MLLQGRQDWLPAQHTVIDTTISSMSSFETSSRIKIPHYARKKTEETSNRVLLSLLSQAATKAHRQESEDKTKEYCRDLISDQLNEIREKFGCFDIMSSRLEAVEESIMFVEKTMETRKAEQQQYAHILACNADGQLTNTEHVTPHQHST